MTPPISPDQTGKGPFSDAKNVTMQTMPEVGGTDEQSGSTHVLPVGNRSVPTPIEAAPRARTPPAIDAMTPVAIQPQAARGAPRPQPAGRTTIMEDAYVLMERMFLIGSNSAASEPTVYKPLKERKIPDSFFNFVAALKPNAENGIGRKDSSHFSQHAGHAIQSSLWNEPQKAFMSPESKVNKKSTKRRNSSPNKSSVRGAPAKKPRGSKSGGARSKKMNACFSLGDGVVSTTETAQGGVADFQLEPGMGDFTNSLDELEWLANDFIDRGIDSNRSQSAPPTFLDPSFGLLDNELGDFSASSFIMEEPAFLVEKGLQLDIRAESRSVDLLPVFQLPPDNGLTA